MSESVTITSGNSGFAPQCSTCKDQRAVLASTLTECAGDRIHRRNEANDKMRNGLRTFIKSVCNTRSSRSREEVNRNNRCFGARRGKTFASQMVTDQTKTSTDLKRLVSASNVKVELPAALDGSHQASLTSSKVRAASTSAPISMQVSARKDAVSLFEHHANGGDNTDLKNWAGKPLPALKHYLKITQNLDKSK
jgi:putative membrane protein